MSVKIKYNCITRPRMATGRPWSVLPTLPGQGRSLITHNQYLLLKS